jgi:hypothetical protein
MRAQFGSSSQAVFFKMRVAGVLHIFQFDTRQGEDICMALQTHINDIMMKRYSKARGPHCSFDSCHLHAPLCCPAHASPACLRMRDKRRNVIEVMSGTTPSCRRL